MFNQNNNAMNIDNPRDKFRGENDVDRDENSLTMIDVFRASASTPISKQARIIPTHSIEFSDIRAKYLDDDLQTIGDKHSSPSLKHESLNSHRKTIFSDCSLPNSSKPKSEDAANRTIQPRTARKRMMENHIQFRCLLKKPHLVTKWPPQLEALFEEAISIIPKEASKTIKICGNTYGRNQYIAFYVTYKSNIQRTAKQVSSHIQAITRANQCTRFIQLIRDGPGESREICETFHNIFTEILSYMSPEMKNALTNRDNSSASLDMERAESPIIVSFDRFEMSYLNFHPVQDSHTFSKCHPCLLNNKLPENFILKSVLIREYPNIARILEIGTQDHQGYHEGMPVNEKPVVLNSIPLLYADVKMDVPSFNTEFRFSSGSYNLATRIALVNLKPEERSSYGLITVVTSNRFIINEYFDVLSPQLTKSKKKTVFLISIGSQFWKDYILKKCDQQKKFRTDDINTDDLNTFTMQQFIIRYESNKVTPKIRKLSIEKIEKDDIRCILIWNFKKARSKSDAFTLVNRISAIYPDIPSEQEHPVFSAPKSSSTQVSRPNCSEYQPGQYNHQQHQKEYHNPNQHQSKHQLPYPYIPSFASSEFCPIPATIHLPPSIDAVNSYNPNQNKIPVPLSAVAQTKHTTSPINQLKPVSIHQAYFQNEYQKLKYKSHSVDQTANRYKYVTEMPISSTSEINHSDSFTAYKTQNSPNYNHSQHHAQKPDIYAALDQVYLNQQQTPASQKKTNDLSMRRKTGVHPTSMLNNGHLNIDVNARNTTTQSSYSVAANDSKFLESTGTDTYESNAGFSFRSGSRSFKGKMGEKVFRGPLINQHNKSLHENNLDFLVPTQTEKIPQGGHQQTDQSISNHSHFERSRIQNPGS